MTRTLELPLLTLGDPGQLSGGHVYQRRIAGAATGYDFAIRFVPLPPGAFLRQSLAAHAALVEAFRRSAAAVLVDSIVAACCAPSLVLKRSPLAVIGILHQPPGGLDGPRASRVLRKRLDLLSYRRARLLIVTGPPVAEALLRTGLPPARIALAPPGCEVSPERGPRAGGGPSRADLRRGRQAALLCVANWHPRKGLRPLLEAMARLPASQATLHLVGDDRVDPAHAAELRRLLQTPELAGRVVVHGPLPASLVTRMYAAADVFVLASTEEPYGMVYSEALAAGLPVVGWRSGNLPHLVESGVDGILVEHGDVGALAAALQRLVEDAALRSRLGKHARRRASTLPSWDRAAAAFFTAIRGALDGSHTPAAPLPDPRVSSR